MTTGFSLRARTKAAQRTLARIGKAMDTKIILRGIGQRHLAWINENFRKGGAERKWAPLSANTIAGRRLGGSGGTQPLRDTGRLAQSFTSNVTVSQVDVGTVDKKAQWHQEGTDPFTIRPRGARALRFMTTQGITFAHEVNHPGLPARPLIPSRVLGEKLAARVVDAYVEREVRKAQAGG